MRPSFLPAPHSHTRAPRTGTLTYRDLYGDRVTVRRPSPWSRIGHFALRAAWHVLAVAGLVLLAVRVFP